MVVVWFCECGSKVRMSFCAAQRRLTAWAGRARTSSAAARSFFMVSLFQWHRLFRQGREIARAQRDDFVVEIELRVVQEAVARPAALAEPDVGAGPRLQHVGEVLAA